jgi:AcrR family transcriptional regulator
MTDQPSTKERIKLATIEAIEQYGIEDVTIRIIAEKANANIASINYHFRTKDDLLQEVLQMTIDHMLEDVFTEVDRPDHDLRSLLQQVLFYLIDGCRRYPGITTAQLRQPIIEKDFDNPGAAGIRRALDQLTGRVIDMLPNQDPDQVRFVIARIMGSIMFMMVTPHFLESNPAGFPDDEAGCRRLAQRYTELALAALQ